MKRILSIIALVFTFSFVYADEGMWLLTMLDNIYPQMQKEGLKLTPEQIYSVNHSSLKDAIVSLGGYCTGEIVSDKGLMLTNHHCGYGNIQAHSTVEQDFLTNGFWSQSYEEELPNPGLFVRFLVSINDVTADVLKGIKDQTPEDKRNEIIKANSDKIEKEALAKLPQNKGYETMVRSFYNDNRYFIITYQKFTDVRLVGAPPSSVGKFGGDTDNWMWTRHTGDFSIFRVYCAPDGTPADYSPNNVPLTPKQSLNVSLNGVKEGDFAMILGYPGRTSRYATSFEVMETMNDVNDPRAKIRGIKQDIWMQDMKSNTEINIKYASKYASSSNYWKYSIGQNQGLKNLNVIAKKQEIEKKFTEWYSKNPDLKARYENVLPNIKKAYEQRNDYVFASTYIRECFTGGSEYIGFARRAKDLYDALKANKTDDIAGLVKKLKAQSAAFFKDYNAPTDKKSSLAMLNLFTTDVQTQFYPTFINDSKNLYGNYDKYIDQLFATSIFVSADKFNQFLANPTAEVLEKDLAFVAANSVFDKIEEIRKYLDPIDEQLKASKRLWFEGLMKMQPDKLFAPDANSTMRLTYGTVGGYSPKDGMDYKFFTTTRGILEKEDETNSEFMVPNKLKNLILNKDFGKYADADGTMHVCFLTNNDITGGNSGSPVMDANGSLIGLAFDGNWEAMSGDIAFEPDLQRTIVVDIRYVLFVIDKLGNCNRLIKEMNIVK